MTLVWITAGVLVLFAVYFFVVLRIRKRREQERERAKGLDPLR